MIHPLYNIPNMRQLYDLNLKGALPLLALLFFGSILFSQQVADINYNPEIPKPEYAPGEGPVVFIDEGHHNFHTKNGRYKSFSNLLERDGYQVEEYKEAFAVENLVQGKILVISNALNEANVEDWSLPNPSAFSREEIEVLQNWVNNGGSLFLIADHMPMAGAAEDLALVFGFEFTNGFVFDTISRGPALFNYEDETLISSSITKGREKSESVSQIATFTGQAFKVPENATPILVFDERYVNFLPEVAWEFDNTTERFNVGGMCQGAYMKFGKGRVVAFGEAAMFSAQLAGSEKRKMGMNNPIAPENYRLLLNIIHWLDGKFD